MGHALLFFTWKMHEIQEIYYPFSASKVRNYALFGEMPTICVNFDEEICSVNKISFVLGLITKNTKRSDVLQ